MNTPACFVTGTDTEVGKTYATCALLHRARQQGLPAVGLKPVAAGTGPDGRNEDVEAIRAANSLPLPERTLNRYLLAPPIAPHIAAREAGVEIRFAPIAADLAEARAQVGPGGLVLVEGAGGFRIPLGPDGDSADLAAALGLPLILVVGMRLGCINHALLTAEAIAARGLPLAGWIANRIDPAMSRFEDNLATLIEWIPAPCLGVIPHAPPGGPAAAAANLQLPAR
ncbi:dethiobiotin synthase [Azovibrio restrictus]|uniref:dethiobiotin synthase n=1 Tax=Azovibrio restrictus TaxID=146938 RepID=UPI0026EEDA01|nr:dethiobiotin synthase [Azovibrio restrictus]